MAIFSEFFTKQKPVFTGLKFGFGSGGGTSVTPATPFTAKIVLVGGGGGGGYAQGGGGGGAGAVAFFDFPIVIGTSYPLRVGSGGRAAQTSAQPGQDGEYSQLTDDPGDYRVGEGGAGGNGGGSPQTGANGDEQGGSGGGGGGPGGGGGGTGTAVPSPRQPYIFGGRNGGSGQPGPGGSGGNKGGGGGGAVDAGSNGLGPGTPGTTGGGPGGNGKEVPSAYLPDAFTQTDIGPNPGQFLGMLTSNPAALRRTFGGGGGGGAEHGQAPTGVGGDGGGGHGGWGSPSIPANGTPAPPAGPTGIIFNGNPNNMDGEPGYEGRGGGGGGGGYTDGTSYGGGGGGGVCIIQSPVDAKITAASIPTPRVNTYTSGGKRYHVILGNNGTLSGSGTVLSGSFSFGPN